MEGFYVMLWESQARPSVTSPVHALKRSYEQTRNALASVAGVKTAGSLEQSEYIYSVNASGQRGGVQQDGAAFSSIAGDSADAFTWGYDAKGQVVSADAGKNADHRYFAYDAIGNRTQHRTGTPVATGGTWAFGYHGDAAATTTGGNALNQYKALSRPWNTIQPVHDQDGNLTDDGDIWLYTWDGEGRLAVETPKAGHLWRGQHRHHYDHRGRLFANATSSWNATTSQWDYSHATRYVYDGWNVIEDYVQWTSYQAHYVWGLDLSGTPQGAGGVGGMLMWNVTNNAGGIWNQHYPCYDGNGNVTQLLDSSGDISAHWEYDPFGNTTQSTPWVAGVEPWEASVNQFPYRFSTKRISHSTGLYYYGYRWYDPWTRRWLSRDPHGEEGRLNLNAFPSNDPINKIDYLGLSGWIQDNTPIGGKCCNESGGTEWGLVDGGWKELKPGDCTRWCEDCDGMTCGGAFYAVYQLDGVCKTPRKDSWPFKDRRWVPGSSGGDGVPSGADGSGGDHRGSHQGDTPPGYNYDPR